MGRSRGKGRSGAPSKGERGSSSRGRHDAAKGRPGAWSWLGVWVGFWVIGLIIYGPALQGDFISDDGHYVAQNPYIQNPNLENVAEILNPFSVVTRLVENYAPVHLMLHAAEWHFFGEQVFGYHVVNVAVHALASMLLAMFFLRTGVPALAAIFGGAVFLVHPANVEAVAWISQLKTSSAMVLALLALLVHPRRPLAGALLFGLALLAKPTATVALPVAAVLAWCRPSAGDDGREGITSALASEWRWFALWAAIFAAFAVVEFGAFSDTAGQAPPLYPEVGVRLRTTIAIALRYLVMAVSGHGLSAFHEPPPATSIFDPWWLGGLAMLGAMGWRFVRVLAQRRPEAVWWAWAAISYAPICGVIPLPYPIADRYLYFILPGLLGAALLIGPELGAWLESRVGPLRDARARGRDPLPRVAAALAVAWILFFAFQASDRAAIWKTAFGLMADAERHYPEGTAAKTRQARRAALAGDAEGAVAALRAAYARGYNRLDHLLTDPAYGPLRSDPGFSALLGDMATEWRDRMEQNDTPSQIELRALAQAYIVLSDAEGAARALERALEVGGPIDEEIARDLEEVRRVLRFEEHRRSRRQGR